MLGNIGETFELLFDKNNKIAYKGKNLIEFKERKSLLPLS